LATAHASRGRGTSGGRDDRVVAGAWDALGHGWRAARAAGAMGAAGELLWGMGAGALLAGARAEGP